MFVAAVFVSVARAAGRTGRRRIGLHDRRHNDGQIRPATSDGFGGAKRLDGEEGKGEYVTDRSEQLFEVLDREVRLDLRDVDAAFIEGFEFPNVVTRRFGGCFFHRMHSPLMRR